VLASKKNVLHVISRGAELSQQALGKMSLWCGSGLLLWWTLNMLITGGTIKWVLSFYFSPDCLLQLSRGLSRLVDLSSFFRRFGDERLLGIGGLPFRSTGSMLQLLNWDTSARYGRAMVRLLFRLRDLGASRGEAHQTIQRVQQ